MLDRLKSPLTVAGRVLLALLFVLAGTSKLTQLDATARYIAAGGLPMPELLAVAVGVFELVGGLALALGFMARWAALALGGFSLVAALLFHRFWDMPAAEQSVQYLLFMKDLAVAGGLFTLAAWGAGAWSVDARRARPGA
jgi:putative oxidoreductase